MFKTEAHPTLSKSISSLFSTRNGEIYLLHLAFSALTTYEILCATLLEMSYYYFEEERHRSRLTVRQLEAGDILWNHTEGTQK